MMLPHHTDSHYPLWHLPLRIILALIVSLSLQLVHSEDSSCAEWGAFNASGAAVGHRTITISDETRGNRTLTVDIWYPATDNGEAFTRYNPLLPSQGVYYKALDNPKVAASSRNLPLLVFSHGYGSIRQQSALLMEHLASWGFVIASPDHAGNSMNDPAGGDIPYTILDRPKDVSFVIDTMLSSPYVDEFHLGGSDAADGTGTVGVLGHSYGGLTSLLVAPDGRLSDQRVKAIMPISPAASFGSFAGDQDYLSKISVPMLVIGGVNDTITPVEPNNKMAFEQTNGLPRWDVVVKDAGHSFFADLCIIFDMLLAFGGDENTAFALMGGGDIDEGKERMSQSLCGTFEMTQSILNYYATAFFTATLLYGDDDENSNQERNAIKKCMMEQAEIFPLSSFEFLDDATISGTSMLDSTPAPNPNTTMDGGDANKTETATSAAAPIREVTALASFATFVLLHFTVLHAN